MQRREGSGRFFAACVLAGLIGLGGRAVLAQVRYGSGMLSTGASPAWRALPSEARFNQQASGMLPSEVRGASLATGAHFFSGRAAQIPSPVSGTVHTVNPYGLSPSGRPPVRPAWSMPAAPLVPSTRPLGGLSPGMSGAVRYGTSFGTSPGLPAAGAGWGPSVPAPSVSTRPLGGAFGASHGGTIRYGGGVSVAAALPPTGLSVGDSDGPDVLGIRRPEDATPVTGLPPDALRVPVGDRTYYRAGWTFYAPQERGGEVVYGEVTPPYGAPVDSLPPGHEIMVVGDTTYYFHEDVYYRATVAGSASPYVVVEPPEEASLPPPIRHLRRMSDFLARVPRFSVEATDTLVSTSGPGGARRPPIRRAVDVSRPDRMRIESRGSNVDRSAWYDGATLSVLDRGRKRYWVADMPGTIDPMLDEVAARLGIRLPLADLLYSDVYRVLITEAGTNVAQYLGKVQLVNVECHHLAFESDTIRWEIWIEVGDRPVPRKLEITGPGPDDPHRYTVTLRQWDLEPYFPDDHFVFQPPPGAEPVPAPSASAEGDPAGLAKPGEPDPAAGHPGRGDHDHGSE